MHVPTPTDSRARCEPGGAVDASTGAGVGGDVRTTGAAHGAGHAASGVLRPDHAQALFPPRDADAETRRRWLASSPWPEVVFAAAGG